VVEVLRELSRLGFKGLMAYVSEQRCLNTVNPKILVQKRYIVGEECQTSSNICCDKVMAEHLYYYVTIIYLVLTTL
jgi:hypothetical protein